METLFLKKVSEIMNEPFGTVKSYLRGLLILNVYLDKEDYNMENDDKLKAFFKEHAQPLRREVWFSRRVMNL
ncbi:MAG: hypothetical protein V8R52_02265, partial [Coprobacter fastidiosus]